MVLLEEDFSNIKKVFKGVWDTKQDIKMLNEASRDTMNGLAERLVDSSGEDLAMVKRILSKAYKEFAETMEDKPEAYSAACMLLEQLVK